MYSTRRRIQVDISMQLFKLRVPEGREGEKADEDEAGAKQTPGND